MKVDSLVPILDSILQPGLQEKYDNAGVQVLFRGTDVTSILVSLDLDRQVIEEAAVKKCGLIVTHHPFFFLPLRKIDSSDSRSSLLMELIERKINIYAAHTNLDKLFYDKLATVLGLDNIELLYPDMNNVGFGTVGFGILARLSEPVSLGELLQKVEKKLNLDFMVYTGDLDKSIMRIAVLNGAGGHFIDRILAGVVADCIITGDVGYHHAKNASCSGTAVIDAGHFGTEFVLLGFLRDRINDCLTKQHGISDMLVQVTEQEKNPMILYRKSYE
jgi:dinuclear metal center YbgI/SA1388 family protein